MFSFLKKLFWLTLLLTILAPLVIAVFALQSEALVSHTQAIDHKDLAIAKRLAEDNDPRRYAPGSVHSATLSEQDLNLLLRYAAQSLPWLSAQAAFRAQAAIDLHQGQASLFTTLTLPDNPLGRYLNISSDLSVSSGHLRIHRLRIGGIELPRSIADLAFQELHKYALHDEAYRAVVDSINGLRLTENQAILLYQWQPRLQGQLRERATQALVDEAERRRLLAYVEQIAQVSRDRYLGEEVQLLQFIEPLMRLARQRSGSHDPLAENRSAILVLALYVNGVNIPRLLGESQTLALEVADKRLLLGGREDFAQHFSISAAVTALSGTSLANSIGLFKEVDDSQGGSGFSFTDLAADRAGVRFAQAATRDQASARHVQMLMSEQPWESWFMPRADDLPEFLSAEEFHKRYGVVGSRSYQRVADEIEARIARLKLYLDE